MKIDLMTIVNLKDADYVVRYLTSTDKDSLARARSVGDVKSLPVVETQLYLSFPVAVETAKRDGYELVHEHHMAGYEAAFLIREEK